MVARGSKLSMTAKTSTAFATRADQLQTEQELTQPVRLGLSDPPLPPVTTDMVKANGFAVYLGETTADIDFGGVRPVTLDLARCKIAEHGQTLITVTLPAWYAALKGID